MAYLSSSQVRELHIELTNHCNAKCPQCGRTNNPALPAGRWSFEDAKTFLDPAFISSLDHIYFCGNFGDPLMHPQLLEIAQLYRSYGVKKMSIYTNGSLKDPSWWSQLPQVLGSNHMVHFSIDGLKDTNHLYRVNTDFDQIIENAKAFIQAGGHAQWDFIAFAHNEHQIASIEKLAHDMGFRKINIKRTSRFTPIHRQNLQPKDLETNLYPHLQRPKDKAYQHKGKDIIPRLINQYGSYEDYLSSCKVRCKTQASGSLYIDFQGSVWPCCWLGNRKFRPLENPAVLNFHDNFKHYEPGFNNLKHHSLDEILSHPFFANHLQKSWSSQLDGAFPSKIRVCAETCGEKFQPQELQHHISPLDE